MKTNDYSYACDISLTRRVEGVGHEIYMDSFLSSPYLFDDLHTRCVNCYRTVRQNCKGMSSFDSEAPKSGKF